MTALMIILALASVGVAIFGWIDFYGDRRSRGLICIGIAVVLGVLCFFV